MNKRIFKLFSFHFSFLNFIKNNLNQKLMTNIFVKLYNIIYFLKWQINDRLKNSIIFLKTKKHFTLNRSPFIFKTSREQFIIIIYLTYCNLNSLFNTKYNFSIYNYKLYLQFFSKHYYLVEKNKNCYLFKNK